MQQQRDLLLDTLAFGGASTVAEMLDSANPSADPVDFEIDDPVKKFLVAEQLRGPIEAIADVDWGSPVAAEIQKAADVPVRNELRKIGPGTWRIFFNAKGEEIDSRPLLGTQE